MAVNERPHFNVKERGDCKRAATLSFFQAGYAAFTRDVKETEVGPT